MAPEEIRKLTSSESPLSKAGRRTGGCGFHFSFQNGMSVVGNVSTASVLFSYQMPCREGKMKKGDLGVAIAMRPSACSRTILLVR